MDSGVQGAPIVEQLTELIGFQVGSLLGWILASRGAPIIEQLNCRVSSEKPSWHLFTYSEACSAYSDAFLLYSKAIVKLNS